nr:hypothetical protein [Leptospira kirschneri]
MAANSKNHRVVFLPIKPEFAHKIINGEKNIEFRKKFSNQNLETIVIYSYSPEQKIIGFAKIDSIVIDTPDSLWDQFSHQGGIDKNRFHTYFYKKVVKELIRKAKRSQTFFRIWVSYVKLLIRFFYYVVPNIII